MTNIEIYTRKECPACTTAKQMLNQSNLTFQEYVVDKDITRDEVLAKFPEAKSLPVIAVDGQQVREVAAFQMLTEVQPKGNVLNEG